MKQYVKQNALLLAVCFLLLLAVIFKRPVKLSVSDSIFIDFGLSEAQVGVVEATEAGPRAYIATFQLANGKVVYVNMDGTCRMEEGR